MGTLGTMGFLMNLRLKSRIFESNNPLGKVCRA